MTRFSRLSVLSLALMVLVLLMVTAGTGSAAPSDEASEPAGSGVVPVVPIERAQLPEGLQELVRDEAITAANSPEFAVARQAWDSDAGFVDQVDYQLEFRSHVDFMSSDYEHIAALLTEKPVNMGSESLGLYMSDAEVAEMNRRFALGDRIELVVEAVTGIGPSNMVEGELPDYGPNYGGIWQDQLDGGRIVLAVVDVSLVDVEALQQIVGGADYLKIVEQPFTYNEIEEYRQMLDSELEKLGVARYVAAVHSDRGRLLEVRVSDPDSLPASFGSTVPPGAFTVVQGPTMQDAARPVNQQHAWANQQPGLRIGVKTPTKTWICTWGFNGHTSGYNYLITAGHCLQQSGGYDNYSGWTSAVQVWQNNSSSRDLTPGDSFVVSINTQTYDAARISSPYADDNCYHGNHYDYTPPSAHCEFQMQERARHDSWEEGSDLTCASLGNSGAYRCGYIVDKDAADRKVAVEMTVIGGDSGSGMKFNNRIDGILTDTSGPQAFFQTAYDVQRMLGDGYFYFNCANGRTTHTDPSDWGVCPDVDA